MSKFENCIDFVLNHEGGYFESPTEKSNFGVTRKFLISINYFTKDPKELTVNDAKNIYLQYFWQKYRLDLFNSDKIASKILDMMINLGPRQAILLIQDALGFEGFNRDGILGHFTRAEINEWPEDRLLGKIIDQNKKFYVKLANDDPKDKKYLIGWLKRAEDLMV